MPGGSVRRRMIIILTTIGTLPFVVFAAAFMAVDGSMGLKEGVGLARDVIQSGRALDALNRARA